MALARTMRYTTVKSALQKGAASFSAIKIGLYFKEWWALQVAPYISPTFEVRQHIPNGSHGMERCCKYGTQCIVQVTGWCSYNSFLWSRFIQKWISTAELGEIFSSVTYFLQGPSFFHSPALLSKSILGGEQTSAWTMKSHCQSVSTPLNLMDQYSRAVSVAISLGETSLLCYLCHANQSQDPKVCAFSPTSWVFNLA